MAAPAKRNRIRKEGRIRLPTYHVGQPILAAAGLPAGWSDFAHRWKKPAQSRLQARLPAPESSRAATETRDSRAHGGVFGAPVGRLKIGRRLQTCPTIRRKLRRFSNLVVHREFLHYH